MHLYRLNPIYWIGFLWGIAKDSKRLCVLLWMAAVVPVWEMAKREMSSWFYPNTTEMTKRGYVSSAIIGIASGILLISYWHITYEPKPEVATEMVHNDMAKDSDSCSSAINTNCTDNEPFVGTGICPGGAPPPPCTSQTGTVYYGNFYDSIEEAHKAAKVGDTIGFISGGYIVNGLPCKISNEEHQTAICGEDGKPRFRLYVGQDGPVMEQIEEAD